MVPITVPFTDAELPSPNQSRDAGILLGRVELALGLILTAFALMAHIQLLINAGHLWRDEAVSITLATTPTIGGLWRDLQTDSFPVLWPLLLRAWASVVGANNDQGLRVLGSIIGGSILGILWWHARQSVSRVPLLGLAFLGLQGSVVCFGDSVRGYGLGVLTGILSVAMLWRAVQRNDIRSWILAFLAALVSVHSVFHNAPFLVASCAGATTVLLRRKQWRSSVLPASIGLICAISLLPYLETLGSSSQWAPIFRYPFTFSRLWFKLRETFADAGTPVFAIWVVTVATGAILTGALPWFDAFRRTPQKNREALLFCGILMVVGTLCHIAFLRVLRYFMQPWYFLTTLAIIGISIDGIATAYPGFRWRLIRIGIANIVAILCIVPLLNLTTQSKTNIDLVAKEIEKTDSSKDLIVVNYWWLGYPFQRDYAGKALWLTIPPLAFPHPSDEINHMGLKRQMQHPYETMEPIFEKARLSLVSGSKLWIVGDLSIPAANQRVDLLPPYDVEGDLHDNDYYLFWTLQLGEFIRDHARSLRRVPVQVDQPVSNYENEALYVAEGWHD